MSQPTIHILVVDDDPSVARSASALLTQRGYKTDSCASVSEATAKLSSNAFDVTLLDVRLQDDDGRRIVDYVRQKELDVFCLMISGEDAIDVAVDALRRGARDYLRKPFSPEELFHRVDAAAESLRLKRQNAAYQKKLRDSDRLHRFLVNSSPDLVFMLDKQGRFRYASDRLLQTLRFDSSQLIGQPFEQLAVPDERNRAEHLVTQALETTNACSTELLLRSGDAGGDPRSHRVILEPIDEGVDGWTRGIYGMARDLTEQKQAEALITFQATHDLLTRLPNRALFNDLMGSAIRLAKRDKHGCAAFYIDIDRFKGINDSLGHAVGDELLRKVASRMRGVLRESDTLARVGGDEFMVLLPHIDTEDQCANVARKISDAVRGPIQVDNHELHVTTSIGMALYPEHGSSMDELIRHADIAMYSVKRANRDGYRMFSASMGEVSSHRFQIEQQLRAALQEGELQLHYQPQIDTQSGAIECMEALVRWAHPDLGLLYPGDFIPIAEECGLIMDIDRWVLAQACRDLNEWTRAGAAGMRVAVNFSAQQFASEDMVSFVLSVLERYGIRGEQLEIEITETDILRDLQSVTAQLLALAEHGVQVALDDFGVGYTSLNYIRNLPVHTVKIDRSFVNDIAATGAVDSSLVTAIVRMAHGMNLRPIAEGVEHREQVDFLNSIGCSGMQGYYFGRPQPGKQTLDLLTLPAAGSA